MQRARPYKSTPFKRPRPSTKATRAKSISAIRAQSIRVGGYASYRKGELKYIDNNANTAVTFGSSTFATPILLNGVSLGTDATNRVGRKLVMKSILLLS